MRKPLFPVAFSRQKIALKLIQCQLTGRDIAAERHALG
jgi:hypothetical protein